VVLNSGISKTSKIRVFNSATLVALSKLYVWGSAVKPAAKAVGKRRWKTTDAVYFTNVCMFFFVNFALVRWNKSNL